MGNSKLALAIERKQAVPNRVRAPRRGRCHPNSIPSSRHLTSQSTTSSPRSASGRLLAVAPVLLRFNPERRWLRFARHRLGHLFTSPLGQSAPNQRLRAATRLRLTPSITWPGSPPRGGISSGGSTRRRCPATLPGRRSSALRGPHRDPSRWGALKGQRGLEAHGGAYPPGRLRPGRPALARPHHRHPAPLAHRRPLQAIADRLIIHLGFPSRCSSRMSVAAALG
jgi:hypothetical protein